MATFRARSLEHAKKIARMYNTEEKKFSKHHKQPAYEKVLIHTGKAAGKEVGGDRIYRFKTKKVKI